MKLLITFILDTTIPDYTKASLKDGTFKSLMDDEVLNYGEKIVGEIEVVEIK